MAKDLVDARKQRLEQQWGTLRNHKVHSYPFKHSPLLLLPSIFPSIRVFSNESSLCIRWPMLPLVLAHKSIIFHSRFEEELEVRSSH